MNQASRSKRQAPFFQRFPELELSLDDVLPAEGAQADNEEAVYAHYLMDLQPTPFDAVARDMRSAAMQGRLGEAEFVSLNGLLEKAKSARSSADDLFRHYAAVKRQAMWIAQVIFVNCCLAEDLDSRVRSFSRLLPQLAKRIAQRRPQDEPSLGPDTASFYAALFLLQTAFDRLFVPPSPAGKYHYESGLYELSSGYRAATEYLDLCAIFEVEAGAAERRLCENITTGWGEGIERPEWDRLNTVYYQGKSPYNGRPNLFATRYNDLLERMLPQFAYSKVRLADTVVAGLKPGRGVRVLEFGAGSGAFLIDLLMALKRRGIPPDEIKYLGIEPSQSMIGGFAGNMLAKLGRTVDQGRFSLQRGSLEEAQERIAELSAEPPRETVGVFSFSPHHIHHCSLRSFLTDARVRQRLDRIYFLEGTERHGWTKMLYMWTDCESPENFNNVGESGDWDSQTLWEEPSRPIPEYPQVTNAWCRARLLT